MSKLPVSSARSSFLQNSSNLKLGPSNAIVAQNATARPYSAEPTLQERYFADGPPVWFEGKNSNRSQTADEAERARRRDLRHLRRQGKSDEPLYELVWLIESCRPGCRCRSGACAVCRRAFQRWFVDAAASCLTAKAKTPGQFTATISIILPIRIRGGHDRAHLRRLIRKCRNLLWSALEQAGLSFVVGGIDISRNHTTTQQPYFQLHFYGFAPFDGAQRAKSKLNALIPSSKHTRRPVHIPLTPFDGNLAGFAYAMKPNFGRRQTIPAGFTDEGVWRRQNTRDGKSLTVAENVLLLPLLHELGLTGRLILRDCVLQIDSDGFAHLKTTASCTRG